MSGNGYADEDKKVTYSNEIAEPLERPGKRAFPDRRLVSAQQLGL
jgi:hypothetical protein